MARRSPLPPAPAQTVTRRAGQRMGIGPAWIALSALVAILPWVFWSGWPTRDPMNDLKWPAAALGLAVVLALSFFEGAPKLALRDVLISSSRGPLFMGGVSIALGLIVSSLFSIAPSLGFQISLREMMFVLFAMRFSTLRVSRARVTSLLAAYSASAVLQALFTLFQWLRAGRAGDEALRAAMMGTFGNPEYAAGWIAPALALLIVWCAAPGRATWVRVLTGFGALIIAASILLSGGRGAALGAVVGVLTALYVGRRQKNAGVNSKNNHERDADAGPRHQRAALAWIGGAIFVLAVGLAFLGPAARRQSLAGRFAEVFDPYSISVRHRVGLLAVTSRMIAHHPLVGAGPGRFGAAFDRERGRLARESAGIGPWVFNDILNDQAASEAHCDPLQWWAEYGLLSFLGLMLIVAGTFVNLMRRARSGSDTLPQLLLLAAFAALAIEMLFAFPLHRPARALLFWALVGASSAESPKETFS